MILLNFVKLEDFDLGEIVINSIDKDGTMEGYDYELVENYLASADFPMTVLEVVLTASAHCGD